MKTSEDKILFNAVYVKCEFVDKSQKIKIHFKDIYKQNNDEFVSDDLVVVNISDNANMSEQIVPFSIGQYISFHADKDFNNIEFTCSHSESKYKKI